MYNDTFLFLKTTVVLLFWFYNTDFIYLRNGCRSSFISETAVTCRRRLLHNYNFGTHNVRRLNSLAVYHSGSSDWSRSSCGDQSRYGYTTTKDHRTDLAAWICGYSPKRWTKTVCCSSCLNSLARRVGVTTTQATRSSSRHSVGR